MTEMDQAWGPGSKASFPSLQLVEIELNSGPAGLPLLQALALPSSSSGLHSTPVNNGKGNKKKGKEKRIPTNWSFSFTWRRCCTFCQLVAWRTPVKVATLLHSCRFILSSWIDCNTPVAHLTLGYDRTSLASGRFSINYILLHRF